MLGFFIIDYWFIDLFSLSIYIVGSFLRVLYGDKCPDMYNSFWKAEVIMGLNFSTKKISYLPS